MAHSARLDADKGFPGAGIGYEHGLQGHGPASSQGDDALHFVVHLLPLRWQSRRSPPAALWRCAAYLQLLLAAPLGLTSGPQLGAVRQGRNSGRHLG